MLIEAWRRFVRRMMIIVLALAVMLCTGIALLAWSASASANAMTDVYQQVGVDRFAHAGCSYVIADQLHRAGMNRFWSGFTTLAIGAAKEQWLDDHFDKGDFAADCAGVLMWRVRF